MVNITTQQIQIEFPNFESHEVEQLEMKLNQLKQDNEEAYNVLVGLFEKITTLKSGVVTKVMAKAAIISTLAEVFGHSPDLFLEASLKEQLERAARHLGNGIIQKRVISEEGTTLKVCHETRMGLEFPYYLQSNLLACLKKLMLGALRLEMVAEEADFPYHLSGPVCDMSW